MELGIYFILIEGHYTRVLFADLLSKKENHCEYIYIANIHYGVSDSEKIRFPISPLQDVHQTNV